MRKGCFGLVSLALLVLVGCRSHPEIPVNDEQSLVMESSLLAAGISAEKPVLSTSDIQPSASSTLYNERQEPVTVHYRFYWYDARGLEMHPLERPRSVTIPAHSAVTLYGSANFLGRTKSDFIYICKVNLDDKMSRYALITALAMFLAGCVGQREPAR